MSAHIITQNNTNAFPADFLEEMHQKTLRQFAIATGLSLAAHAVVLLILAAPGYESAQLAGGGASFSLSSGGLGDGGDPLPLNAAQAKTETSADLDAKAAAPDYPPLEKREAPQHPIKQKHMPDMQTALSALREAASQPVAQPVATPVTSSSRNAAGMEKTPATLASRASAGSNGGKAAASASKAMETAAAASAPSPSATAGKGTANEEAGSGSGAAKTGSGDSATSNYTGIVTAHIRRNRRSNLAGAGSVILRIDIAPGGRIDDIDIYRSSGSTRFDRQALRMAKMAAPYPKPPAGQGPVLIRIKGS